MASLNSLDDVTAKASFLKNPELKAMTFSHLQVKNVKKCRRLLNAALACKDFLEVALDALWEELDSLVPLLKVLPALKLEDDAYVLSGNVSQADRDRLQYYSRKVKVFSTSAIDTDNPQVHPSTYIRIAQLQSSALFPSLRHLHYNLDDRSIHHIFLFLSPLLDSLELADIKGFENTVVGPFLATLSSQMLSRIVLRNGQMSADILKTSIVHFKQLRSLELIDAVLSDFALLEVLGTLPYLANFNLALMDFDFASHPAHGPEISSSQGGGPRYFNALKSLKVTGPLFLIQHLLGFIDSPCLQSISVYAVIYHDHDHEPEDSFTRSMTIVASKWSQSLKYLLIQDRSRDVTHRLALVISKSLMMLMDLHEMRIFGLTGWRMEIMDDDVRRLVMSWSKLRILKLPFFGNQFISWSTLKIIAENCPELRSLHIQLDTSTIPSLDTSSKSLHHKLELLKVGNTYPSSTQTTLKYQIQVTRHLNLIFPYLKSIEVQPNDVTWSGIRDLVQLCHEFRDASL